MRIEFLSLCTQPIETTTCPDSICFVAAVAWSKLRRFAAPGRLNCGYASGNVVLLRNKARNASRLTMQAADLEAEKVCRQLGLIPLRGRLHSRVLRHTRNVL